MSIELEPVGSLDCLNVKVVKAEHLRNDNSWLAGVSDPFLEVELLNGDGVIKARAETTTVHDSLHPEWNEEFTFKFVEADDLLAFRVMDEDILGHHDILGKCMLKLGELQKGFDQTVQLTDADGKPGNSTLKLEIKPPFVPLCQSSTGWGEEHSGFKTNQYVMWKKSNSQIPARSVGRIVGFSGGSANVAYLHLDHHYLFRPQDLDHFTPNTIKLSLDPTKGGPKEITGIYQIMPEPEKSMEEHGARPIYKLLNKQMFLYYWAPHEAWQVGANFEGDYPAFRSKDQHHICPTTVENWMLRGRDTFEDYKLDTDVLDGNANGWCVLQRFANHFFEAEFFTAQNQAEARYTALPDEVDKMLVNPGGIQDQKSIPSGADCDKAFAEFRASYLDGAGPAPRAITGHHELKTMFCLVEQIEMGVENCKTEFFPMASMAWAAAKSMSTPRIIVGPGGVVIHTFDKGAEWARCAEMMECWIKKTESPFDDDEFSKMKDLLEREPVFVNIYDVVDAKAVRGINAALELIGSGAFHAGIEVYGKEYSFGGFAEEPADPDAVGYMIYEPKACHFGRFKETIYLGRTGISSDDVYKVLLREMAPNWKGVDYSLTTKNCCHFSDAFSKNLGASSIPSWVLSLANAGAAVEKFVNAIGNIAAEGHKDPNDLNYRCGDFSRGLALRATRRIFPCFATSER